MGAWLIIAGSHFFSSPLWPACKVPWFGCAPIAGMLSRAPGGRARSLPQSRSTFSSTGMCRPQQRNPGSRHSAGAIRSHEEPGQPSARSHSLSSSRAHRRGDLAQEDVLDAEQVESVRKLQLGREASQQASICRPTYLGQSCQVPCLRVSLRRVSSLGQIRIAVRRYFGSQSRGTRPRTSTDPASWDIMGGYKSWRHARLRGIQDSACLHACCTCRAP